MHEADHAQPAAVDATSALASLAEMRAGMAAQGGDLPVPPDPLRITDYDADGTPLRLYHPAGEQTDTPLPLLVFLHGGGWLLGDLDTHDACCRWLSASAGCAVLAVGYRLAPEFPFPAALDDAAAALRWARAEAASLGCDPSRIAVGGESAGANLAAALTLRLREEGMPQPLFQLLVHPPTDLTLEQPSIRSVTLPGLDLSLLQTFVVAYAGATPLRDPLLSPLHADDLSGLAPAIVVTVEHDPLRDDGEHYALALAQAGIAVSLQRLPDLPHGFMFLPATMPTVGDAFRLIGERVTRYFRVA